MSKQFRLYFVDMFTHGTHHVLECGACGTTFVTDELPRVGLSNDHSGTVLGHLQEAARRGQQLAEEARKSEAVAHAESEVTKALGAAEKTIDGWLSSLQKKLDGESSD